MEETSLVEKAIKEEYGPACFCPQCRAPYGRFGSLFGWQQTTRGRYFCYNCGSTGRIHYNGEEIPWLIPD